jgi:hypothetical protein
LLDEDNKPNRYSIRYGTTGEFDLLVTVCLLDDDNDVIDYLYDCDSVEEAERFISNTGGILVTEEELNTPKVDPFTVETLRRIREEGASRQLDYRIEQHLCQSSTHSDHLYRFHDSARKVTTDVQDALLLLAETLPGWAVDLYIEGRAILGNGTREDAYAAITPPAKDGEFRHYMQDIEDIGGYSAKAVSLPLALLDAIYQVKITQP